MQHLLEVMYSAHQHMPMDKAAHHVVVLELPHRLGEFLEISNKLINNLKQTIFWIFRKISAHEFERGGLLKPIVNTIDGTPTFLSIHTQNECSTNTANNQVGGYHSCSTLMRPQRLSRNELKQLDEKELIFELVRYYLSYFPLLFCFPFLWFLYYVLYYSIRI